MDDEQLANELRGGVVVMGNRLCPHCKRHTEVRLAQRITGAGVRNACWVCTECLGLVPSPRGGMWIPHEKVEALGVLVEDLPIYRDDSKDYRCARCGARGAQLHHWAPRGIFLADAETWPKDLLCQTCHDQWHDIVTPQLRSGAKCA